MTHKRSDLPSLAVIGGGASGLFAAATAARALREAGEQADIQVYEANAEPAKKILVSGNGRCNLSNRSISAALYTGGDPKLVNAVLRRFSNDDLLAFLHASGMLTREDAAGRIYPNSNQAANMRDFLVYLCEQNGVNIHTDCRVASLIKQNGAFLINGAHRADAVILACGSSAAPRNGGRDSLFLAEQLGATTVPFAPALTCLKIQGFSKYQLKGLRADGRLTVFGGSGAAAQDRGEIQYAEYGLSGIPAMQVSAAAGRLLRAGAQVSVEIDSLPALPQATVSAMMDDASARNGATPVLIFLNGLFPKRLSAFFMKNCGIDTDAGMHSLSAAVRARLLAQIKRLRFQVADVGSFADAQAASGGVTASSLEHETLALKACPGCFVCGEMIDVVGACGGYNLQWAWSSGYVAGLSAAREILL